MSVVVKKNRATLPSLVSDFFNGAGLFPSVFDADGSLFDLNGGALSMPNVNIAESPKDFKVELAAPGLESKDFKVSVDNGVLTISSEKKNEKEESGKNYKRREFAYNSFSRSFTLPENTLSDKIDARYEGGILHLSIPKKEVTVSKPVKEIKVS